MKRFLLLFLTLAVLVCLKAEEKALATKECKCEEGQKDCPCLGQAAEDKTKQNVFTDNLKIKGKIDGKDKKLKLSIKLGKPKSHKAKKEKIVKAKLVKAAKKAAKLNKMIKKASPALKKELIKKKKVLKKQIKIMKRQLIVLKIQKKKLKKEIKKLPIAVSKAKKAEKKVITTKCQAMSEKIVKAEEKLKEMKIKFREICSNVVIKKSQKTKVILTKEKAKVEEIAKKIREAKAKLKVTPSYEAKKITKELKKLTTEIKKAKEIVRQVRKKDEKLDKKVIKVQVKIQKAKAKELQAKFEVEKKKEIKIAKQIQKIEEKIKIYIKKINVDVKSNVAKKLMEDVKVLKQNVNVLKNKQEKQKKIVKFTFNVAKEAVVKASVIKKDLTKEMKAKKCIALEKKLVDQITYSNQIKYKFYQACETANEYKIVKYEDYVDEIEDKIADTVIKIEDAKKNTTAAAVKAKIKCEDELIQTEKQTKANLDEINTKLKLIEDQTGVYQKMLVDLKKETEMKKKAELLNIKLLTEKNQKERERLMFKITQIQTTVKSLRIQQDKDKKQAELMQIELQKKAQELMVIQRQAALKKQKELQDKKNKLKLKMIAITNAIVKAHDVNIKKALTNQKAEEEAKYLKLKTKIKLTKETAKTLKVDIELIKRATTEEAKLALAKKIALEKIQKERLEKLRKEWKTETEDDLNTSIKKMQAFYSEKIAKLEKEMAQIVVERDSYTFYSKSEYIKLKKKRLEELKIEYDNKISKLMTKLEKVKKDYITWKLKADSDLATEMISTKKKYKIKLENKIVELEKKLKKFTESKERAVNNYILTLKQKLVKEKAILTQKMMTLKSEVASLKAEALKNEVKLRGEVAQAKADAKALKVSLDASKDDVTTFEKIFSEEKVKISKSYSELLEKQIKTDQLLLTKNKSRLAKIQKEYLDSKKELLAKIKKAQDEAKELTRHVNEQKALYKTLTTEYASTKSSWTTKYTEEMKKQKTIYTEMEIEYKAQLTEVETEYKLKLKETATYKANILEKEKIIKGMKDMRAKRTKLAETIVELEKLIAIHQGKVSELEIRRKSLCEMGTPGPSEKVKCATLLNESQKLLKEDSDLAKKLAALRKQYDAL